MTPKAREALEKILRYAHLYGAKKTERLLNEFLKTYPSAWPLWPAFATYSSTAMAMWTTPACY